MVDLSISSVQPAAADDILGVTSIAAPSAAATAAALSAATTTPHQPEPAKIDNPFHLTMREQGAWWKRRLAEADYWIETADALVLAMNLYERECPLILQGPPGAGKTSLVYAVARILAAPVARLECFKSIPPSRLLYGFDARVQELELKRYQHERGALPEDVRPILYQEKCRVPGVIARAYLNPHPHSIVLINEVDKVPADEEFDAAMLEPLDEHRITVSETGEEIRPVTKRPPHYFLTSNAGSRDASGRESLSHPLLRRGDEMYLPEADRERLYLVLRQMAPRLDAHIVRETAIWLERIKKTKLQKPVSLSENIRFARSLQHFLPFAELTPELCDWCLHRIGKSREDRVKLQTNYRAAFEYSRQERARWRPSFAE